MASKRWKQQICVPFGADRPRRRIPAVRPEPGLQQEQCGDETGRRVVRWVCQIEWDEECNRHQVYWENAGDPRSEERSRISMATLREFLPIDMEEDKAAKNEKEINSQISSFDPSGSSQ